MKQTKIIFWLILLLIVLPGITIASDMRLLLLDTDQGGTVDGLEILLNGTDPDNAIDDAVGDQDGDGISDIDEDILGTDLKKSDTDNDGYFDGIEYISGYSPLIPNKKSENTNPIDSGLLKPKLYTIESVIIASDSIHLTGSAPGSIDLYIFLIDDNREVYKKEKITSNDTGSWTANVSLLDPGKYTAYVAYVTDNQVVVAKSQKKIITIESVKNELAGSFDNNQALIDDELPQKSLFNKYQFYGVAIGLGVVGVIGLALGFKFFRKKRAVKLIKKNTQSD